MDDGRYSYKEQDMLLDQLLDEDASLFRRLGQVRLMWSLIALSVAFGAMIYLVWFSYPTAGVNDPNATPILYAESGSYKERPDDVGGMQIEHKDSTVFNSIRGGQTDEGDAENLFAKSSVDDTEPVDREKLFSGLKTEPMAIQDVEEDTVEPDPVRIEAPAPVIEMVKETVRQDQPVLKVDVVPVQPPKPRPATTKVSAADIIANVAQSAPTAKTAPVKAVSSGNLYVQLGSVKSDAAARSEWKRLQKDFSSQLSDLNLRVQNVTIAGKGTFYRIQGGAVTNAQAKKICAAVNNVRPQGCLVVKK